VEFIAFVVDGGSLLLLVDQIKSLLGDVCLDDIVHTDVAFVSIHVYNVDPQQ